MKPKIEASIIRHTNFTAIRVSTRTHTFIGILVRNFCRLPGIVKIEVYRKGRDHYTETFVGYADREEARRLTPALINAAVEKLRAA